MSAPTRRGSSRGGRGGHEPRARLISREHRAVELAIRGWTQAQIAADLGISQAAVSKLLKRVETRVLRETVDTLARHKVRQTQRLEHIVAESLQAWHASKSEHTRRRQRKIDRSGGADQTLAEIVVDPRHGDPRYLDEARKALADVRKIWGLEAPQRVEVRPVRNPYEEWTDEALDAEIVRQQQLIEAAGVGGLSAPVSPRTPEEGEER